MNKKFKVTGMHCKSCEILIREGLEELGVKVKEISHKDGIVNVEFDEKKIDESKIRNAILNEGYKVVN